MAICCHDTQASLGACVHALDVGLAPEGFDQGASLFGGKRIAKLRLDPSLRRSFDRGRSLNLVSFRTCVLEVVSNFGLQNVRTRAENGLDAIADHYHSGGAKRLQPVRVDLGWILKLYPESRNAGVEIHDVAAPPQRAHDL